MHKKKETPKHRSWLYFRSLVCSAWRRSDSMVLPYEASAKTLHQTCFVASSSVNLQLWLGGFQAFPENKARFNRTDEACHFLFASFLRCVTYSSTWAFPHCDSASWKSLIRVHYSSQPSTLSHRPLNRTAGSQRTVIFRRRQKVANVSSTKKKKKIASVTHLRAGHPGCVEIRTLVPFLWNGAISLFCQQLSESFVCSSDSWIELSEIQNHAATIIFIQMQLDQLLHSSNMFSGLCGAFGFSAATNWTKKVLIYK